MFENLKETVHFMLSNDEIKNLKAEYWQLNIRYMQLDRLLFLHDYAMLPCELPCDRAILAKQKNIMYEYLLILEDRAKKEGINLTDTRRYKNAKSKTN